MFKKVGPPNQATQKELTKGNPNLLSKGFITLTSTKIKIPFSWSRNMFRNRMIHMWEEF